MKFGTVSAGLAVLAVAYAGSAALAQDNDFAYVGASLFGENEVGHDGAGEGADGDFTAELNLAEGELCYLLEVEGLDEVAAAHLHQGGKDMNGSPVVTLEVASDGEDICTPVDPALLKKIAKSPDRYYVNVHTAAFPQGAVRGQLGE